MPLLFIEVAILQLILAKLFIKHGGLMMLIFVRWLLLGSLLWSCVTFAQNKVVVVPLFGDESSHEHPDKEYINLSAAAFQPKQSFSSYSHDNGLLSTNAGATEHILFVANIVFPNDVRVREMTATYQDGNEERDVEIRLTAVRYSNTGSAVFAEIRSTGFSFSQFTRRSAPLVLAASANGVSYNPIDNMSNAYFVEVALRNGAELRGVTIAYTTTID